MNTKGYPFFSVIFLRLTALFFSHFFKQTFLFAHFSSVTDLRLPIFNHFSSVTDLGLPIFNHFLKQTLALYLKVWIIVKSSVIALQINCLKQNRCPDSTRAPNFSVFWYHNCCTSGRSLCRWLQPQAHPGVGPGRGEALEPYLRVQINISDICERFSMISCNKKMNAGSLQENFRPYECAMCDKRFLYLYSFKDWQICTSMMNEKSLTWMLSLQNLFEGAN